jgi:hypothetical protein
MKLRVVKNIATASKLPMADAVAEIGRAAIRIPIAISRTPREFEKSPHAQYLIHPSQEGTVWDHGFNGLRFVGSELHCSGVQLQEGKDRTGHFDLETKFLASRIKATARVPKPGELSDEEREAFSVVAQKSGNLTMQRYNTGLGGDKTFN